ncbi:unnamed protein product, partial [Meganyctiphanes norvegica]
ASGQQQRPDGGRYFAVNGKPCVVYNGTATCVKGTTTPLWCYTDHRFGDWGTCMELERFRCNSDGVTRHGDCDPASDKYCCSPAGWCGNSNAHCDCGYPKCRNLR